MKKLTRKERNVMELFWNKGRMSINDLQDTHTDSLPQLDTLFILLHKLQEKGYIKCSESSPIQYYATISKKDYDVMNIETLVKKCFGCSYMTTLSDL